MAGVKKAYRALLGREALNRNWGTCKDLKKEKGGGMSLLRKAQARERTLPALPARGKFSSSL